MSVIFLQVNKEQRNSATAYDYGIIMNDRPIEIFLRGVNGLTALFQHDVRLSNPINSTPRIGNSSSLLHNPAQPQALSESAL